MFQIFEENRTDTASEVAAHIKQRKKEEKGEILNRFYFYRNEN